MYKNHAAEIHLRLLPLDISAVVICKDEEDPRIWVPSRLLALNDSSKSVLN